MLNRVDLVAKIADKSGLTKGDADNALRGMIETITEAVKAGEGVQLVGFGTFEVKERGARSGRNPKTGETITIAATKAVTFKAGKALKEAAKG